MAIRFIHLADTHLGARHPGREPGDPFLRNMRRSLAPARRGEVDLVMHGGDLFNRSRPPPRVLAAAAAELIEAADGGAEMVIVPGNHERSAHPARLLLGHPRIHLVEAPCRVALHIKGAEVSVYSFPFLRRSPRRRYEATLRETGWPRGRTDASILLCHQTFDTATVGPADFVFHPGPDVIPRSWIPKEIDYAALGHIHRHQALLHPHCPDLPVVYAGSTERTSRAERYEPKGLVRGEFLPGGGVRWRFQTLSTRPVPPSTCRFLGRTGPVG